MVFVLTLVYFYYLMKPKSKRLEISRSTKFLRTFLEKIKLDSELVQ